MDGEFRVQLKSYDAAQLIQAFKEYYGDNLTNAYDKSAYKVSGYVKQTDFCSGYQTNDSLFMVYNREGNALKIYVESFNQQDLNNLKNTINRYFKSITEMLDDKEIKWSKPQATILVEKSPLTGVVKTKKDYLKETFENQREKLFFLPISTVLAAGLAFYWNIADKGDTTKDVKKAVISTLEAIIGFVLLFLVQLLFVRNKREFTFKF
jgi:hypothetical protein